MARPPHKLKKEKLTEAVGGMRTLDDVGIKIHRLKHLSLHGKMLLADHARAVIGSINLAPGSFDSRRELAIEVHAPEVVERLRDVVHHDWEHSHPLDLSDEGLLEEFHEHDIDATEQLALDAKRRRTR
jgi:phosphatidylserine/phosphatidylglycerophosphate/cardiolipin synthase-like enzyme